MDAERQEREGWAAPSLMTPSWTALYVSVPATACATSRVSLRPPRQSDEEHLITTLRSTPEPHSDARGVSGSGDGSRMLRCGPAGELVPRPIVRGGGPGGDGRRVRQLLRKLSPGRQTLNHEDGHSLDHDGSCLDHGHAKLDLSELVDHGRTKIDHDAYDLCSKDDNGEPRGVTSGGRLPRQLDRFRARRGDVGRLRPRASGDDDGPATSRSAREPGRRQSRRGRDSKARSSSIRRSRA